MTLADCDALHYRQEVLCRRCRAKEGEKKKKKAVSVFHGGRLVAPPCLCRDMKNIHFSLGYNWNILANFNNAIYFPDGIHYFVCQKNFVALRAQNEGHSLAKVKFYLEGGGMWLREGSFTSTADTRQIIHLMCANPS